MTYKRALIHNSFLNLWFRLVSKGPESGYSSKLFLFVLFPQKSFSITSPFISWLSHKLCNFPGLENDTIVNFPQLTESLSSTNNNEYLCFSWMESAPTISTGFFLFLPLMTYMSSGLIPFPPSPYCSFRASMMLIPKSAFFGLTKEPLFGCL